MPLLGIDTGGTFTDFVHYDGRKLTTHKVLSSPDDPARAIVQGLQDLGIPLQGLNVVHGSTVATNAVLEGKGARTAYITNRGFADVLAIGRQARRELYNLQPQPVAAPVPDDLLIETGGRLSAQGEVIEDLTPQDLEELRRKIARLQPQSAAINLLFSFLDARFEREIRAALPAGMFVSCSADVLREYREYERGIATWLNAYVGPLMQGYLQRLCGKIAPAQLAVMRSSGETCSAEQAGGEAVQLMLSGPAGGLAGAGFVAAQAGSTRIMTLDMGGTSTDVALLDGAPMLTNRGRIAGYPVGVPMVDMHTIGAGGGSIAFVDAGGGVQVGPESAGSDPGPACYGRGGTRPTVTDANLVLGRLPPSIRLGNSLVPDVDAARASLSRLGTELGLSGVVAAAGVIRIVNEHMVQALRVISLQRGIDPREFMLVAFGGAGGLHVCELADALGMRHAMVPRNAGVLSALGMLVAPRGRQLSQTLGCLLTDCSEERIAAVLAGLSARGRDALAAEGVDTGTLEEQASLDLCYRGQGHALNVPWRGLQQAQDDFHRAHEQRYGHRLATPLELVNVRLGIKSETGAPQLPRHIASSGAVTLFNRVHGYREPVPVLARDGMSAGSVRPGPLILCDADATTFIAGGWDCEIDGHGNILMHKSVGREL